MERHYTLRPMPPQNGVWRVIILTQLVYPPPVRTTGTMLPVGTMKSVEREVDLQLQGLMSWGRSWQPGRKQETAFYTWGHWWLVELECCSVWSRWFLFFWGGRDGGLLKTALRSQRCVTIIWTRHNLLCLFFSHNDFVLDDCQRVAALLIRWVLRYE